VGHSSGDLFFLLPDRVKWCATIYGSVSASDGNWSHNAPAPDSGSWRLWGLGDPRWVKGTVRLSFLDRWSWQASFWSSVETGANRKRVPNLKPTICRSGEAGGKPPQSVPDWPAHRRRRLIPGAAPPVHLRRLRGASVQPRGFLMLGLTQRKRVITPHIPPHFIGGCNLVLSGQLTQIGRWLANVQRFRPKSSTASRIHGRNCATIQRIRKCTPIRRS
jgi:hypothetical protein